MGEIVIFYNYELCYILAAGDPTKILKYFELTKNNSESYSFIINPSILKSRKYSHLQLAEFLGICSLRNYDDYVANKTVDLDRSLIPPWIDVDSLSNPLIVPTEHKIILSTEKEK